MTINKTYIQDKYGNKYFFDINTDTGKTSSSEIADSPIDARKGATLQDKRVVNMKTIGISGKFSSRCSNNSSFNVADNRLGIIISYFEKALAKNEIYTVCRKGSIYDNMMLSKVNLKFGEYCSTVEVDLGFTEVNIIGVEIVEGYKVLNSKDAYKIAESLNLITTSVEDYYTLKAISPRLSGWYNPDSGYAVIYIYNPNNKEFKMTAQTNIAYRQYGQDRSAQVTKQVEGQSEVMVMQNIGVNSENIRITCYFETDEYNVSLLDLNILPV